MKITSIEPQRNKNRVNIYVDDVFSIGIAEELRFKHKLEVGMEVDDDFIKDVLQSEEQNKVLNYALNLQSDWQRGDKEMYHALKRENVEESYLKNAMKCGRARGGVEVRS